jgi:hypothetical protein
VPEPSDYWTEIRDRLARLGTDPVLIGALAASLYRATPRRSVDVDFLVRTLVGVVESFTADGYEVRTMAEPGGEPFVAFIRGHGQRIDAILAETAYQRTAIERAVAGALTVEDVIVHKLIAWRPRDQDDIESILATDPALDVEYIEHWAGEWDVMDRWEEARQRWMH